MDREKEETLRRVLSDAIRFGAAVGSWHDSSQKWHQRVGGECIEAIKEGAFSEISFEFRRIDEKQCSLCHQVKPTDRIKEEEERALKLKEKAEYERLKKKFGEDDKHE